MSDKTSKTSKTTAKPRQVNSTVANLLGGNPAVGSFFELSKGRGTAVVLKDDVDTKPLLDVLKASAGKTVDVALAPSGNYAVHRSKDGKRYLILTARVKARKDAGFDEVKPKRTSQEHAPVRQDRDLDAFLDACRKAVAGLIPATNEAQAELTGKNERSPRIYPYDAIETVGKTFTDSNGRTWNFGKCESFNAGKTGTRAHGNYREFMAQALCYAGGAMDSRAPRKDTAVAVQNEDGTWTVPARAKDASAK